MQTDFLYDVITLISLVIVFKPPRRATSAQLVSTYSLKPTVEWSCTTKVGKGNNLMSAQVVVEEEVKMRSCGRLTDLLEVP